MAWLQATKSKSWGVKLNYCLHNLKKMYLYGISTRSVAADYEERPPDYSSLHSRITLLQGKPHSFTLTNYRIREHAYGFNPILCTQWLRCTR